MRSLWAAHRSSPCAQTSRLGAGNRRPTQPCAGADAQDLAREDSDVRRSAPRASIPSRCIRRLCMECCCMTSAAEHRRPVPSDGEAILNALPNPVLLVAPDGKIVDANMAAESFFEISTQFLRRQLLKELVPFGSPLLALIDQVRSSGSPLDEYKVDVGTPPIAADRQAGLY